MEGDKMKKPGFLVLSLLIFGSFILAQTIIENPEKPLSKNAGRVLELQEVLRITDESGEFYFKRPSLINVASDGCIYLRDEDQFLKFSSQGDFIKNMFKKGQGPGEIQGSFSYGLKDDNIYIYDNRNRKIICLDKGGNLIKELPIKKKRSLRFLGVVDDRIIFSSLKPPPREERGEKFIDMENQLISISLKDKTEREIVKIPTRWWFSPSMMMSIDPFLVILGSNGQSLYINHTEEYMIKVLDIKTGEVTRSFKRKYKRIKEKKRTAGIRSNIKIKLPKREFMNDIRYFFNGGETLWVRTSTTDKTKGSLFDIFNKEGNYIDSFYLTAKSSLVTVHKDYIFVRETDEEEMISIVKYKIVKKDGAN